MTLRIKAAAGSMALLLSLAACGSGDDLSKKSPSEILNDARTSADDASSVHVTGSVTQDGSKSIVDILLTNNGDGKDELTSDGQTISIIKSRNTIYAKGIPGSTGPGYQKLEANDPRVAQLSQALDKKTFLQQILSTNKEFTLAGKDKVGDQDTLKLAEKSGQSTLRVADNADKPYPMQIEGNGPMTVSIVFSGWDEDAHIAAPQVGS
ncbi:MAG TPA: hypothetical protein VGJ13_03115 [Pseudonocardiaceae bacterium]